MEIVGQFEGEADGQLVVGRRVPGSGGDDEVVEPGVEVLEDGLLEGLLQSVVEEAEVDRACRGDERGRVEQVEDLGPGRGDGQALGFLDLEVDDQVVVRVVGAVGEVCGLLEGIRAGALAFEELEQLDFFDFVGNEVEVFVEEWQDLVLEEAA